MAAKVRDLLGVIAIGMGFGYSLSRVGFSSWDEVHAMFTFSGLNLLIAFMVAIAVLAPTWLVIKKLTSPHWSPRKIHRGTFLGGLLFGAGWALSGACPSIAAVQLGEGQLGAAFTFLGIFAGNFLYSVTHERNFRWTTGSCLDD